MYDFGLDSVVCSVDGRGECPSEFHFVCHFLSRAGRSSLRGIEVFVERRMKVFAAREIARGFGRVYRRECATRGVNRRRDSACMMTIISSCQHQETTHNESSDVWYSQGGVCDLRLQGSPGFGEPQTRLGLAPRAATTPMGDRYSTTLTIFLVLVPCWNHIGMASDYSVLEGIVYLTVGTSVQHARLYSL